MPSLSPQNHMAIHRKIILISTTTSIATPSLPSRLPPDVILEIVQHVLDAYFFKLSASEKQKTTEAMTPLVLGGPWVHSQINRLWRQAVVYAPSLWRRIDISHAVTERMVNAERLLELMIQRSSKMALKFRYSSLSYTTVMSLHRYPRSDHWSLVPVSRLESVTSTDIALLGILMKSSARWHTADIAIDLTMVERLNVIKGKIAKLESLILDVSVEGHSDDEDEEDSDEDDSNEDTETFLSELVAFSVAPNLRYLALPKGLETSVTMFPWNRLMQYRGKTSFPDRHVADLRYMSNLVECSVRSRDWDWSPHSEILLLPNLITLIINNMTLLAMIRAPALKHLDITGTYPFRVDKSDGSTPVSAFVERSACNLESFRMNCDWCYAEAVRKTLREVQSLEVVHLVYVDPDMLCMFLDIHGRTNGIYSPSLRRLVIDTEERMFTGEHSLTGLLEQFDITMHQPEFAWDPKYPLLEITCTAPPEDLNKTAERCPDGSSKIFRGEARLVSKDGASPFDVPRNLNAEWPTIRDGLWDGVLDYWT